VNINKVVINILQGSVVTNRVRWANYTIQLQISYSVYSAFAKIMKVGSL